jgi:transposase
MLHPRHPLVIFRGGSCSLVAQKGDQTMEVLYARCGGLDVHQRFVVACLSVIEEGQRRKETRTFRCVTSELLALRRWLAEEGCTHVALESTGVYWRPVYDRLVGTCAVIVANAQHIKKVPGRKTDVQDAEWLADLRHAWAADP